MGTREPPGRGESDPVIERRSDIWAAAERDGAWVVVTTNGVTRRDGCAVMGRGIAREAARRYPSLLHRLGRDLTLRGNKVNVYRDLRVITLPVKGHWRDCADMDLIREGAKRVREIADMLAAPVYSVRPGCGNGGLDWADVRPVVAPHFGDRVVVYER